MTSTQTPLQSAGASAGDSPRPRARWNRAVLAIAALAMVLLVALSGTVVVAVNERQDAEAAEAAADVRVEQVEAEREVLRGQLAGSETALTAVNEDLTKTQHRLGKCTVLTPVATHLLRSLDAATASQVAMIHKHWGKVGRRTKTSTRHLKRAIHVRKAEGFKTLPDLIDACSA